MLNAIQYKANISSDDKWAILAGLRFLFASWVLFAHTYNFSPISRAMPVPSKSGLIAVLCFLAISGFSINHSISQRRNEYLMRRFWRIFPINALSILIALLAYFILGPNLFDIAGSYPMPHWWQWIGCLFLLQSLLPVEILVLFPAWSLSTEVIYYLLAPVLKKCSSIAIIMLAAMSCCLFLAWPYITNRYIGGTYGGVVIGMIWAWLVGWLASQRYPYWMVGFCLLLGFLCIRLQGDAFGIVDLQSKAYNYLAWTITILVLFYSGTTYNIKMKRVLNYLGEISYPLYLLHYPVLFILTSSILRRHPEFNYGFIQVIISLAVAMIAYHWVDKPLRYSWQRRSKNKSDANILFPSTAS